MLQMRTGLRVLLTGATGFIGRALSARLATEGARVRAAVRGTARLPSGVEGIAVGELSGSTDWSEACRGIDAVIHLAGDTGRDSGSGSDSAMRVVNVDATRSLAQ